MANPEHFEILQQGVEIWNKWREAHPNIEPDLAGEDFSGRHLNGINLSATNLSRVTLDRSILREACFKGAYLFRTHFIETELVKADFSEAFIGVTTFASVDLSSAKGLDTIKHYGPSIVSIDTLYKSKGKIPEVFLRGCGVPESFITHLKSLIIQPFEFYKCFISYSSKDKEFVERLYVDLQNKGVRCFYAPEDMKIGDKFRIRIDEAIRYHEKLLLVLSENSIASDWVEKEVETAMEREREEKRLVLFPIRLDDASEKTKSGWAGDVRRTRHIGDFRNWKNHDDYQKSFERLLRDLKAENT